jgi:hypothetical protein
MTLKKSQQSLKDWTSQKWRTRSGKPSTQGSEATGERYLPEKAIKAMSSSEYAASTKKKREDTAKGKQHSKQPKKAATIARKYRNTGGTVNKQKFETTMKEYGEGTLKSGSGSPVTSTEQAFAIAFSKARAAKQMGGLMAAPHTNNKRMIAMADGGSMMVPAEGVPQDTYPNIPPEEMAEAKASQLPDEQMEQDYLGYVINETLAPEEQEYLKNALESDPQLSAIIDKVVVTASEFSGAGEVEGPGTGVSDSIPARLSDGEFVFTRKATDQIGADNLQVMMDDAERAYDGGLMSRPSDAQQTTLTDDEKIQRQMVGATRMPSIS